MLPLIALVAVGALTAAAVSRSKRRAAGLRKRWVQGVSPGTFRIVGQKLVESTEQILATDEVPLDNRFGNQSFVSEHEFSRSATVMIEMDWSGSGSLGVEATLLAALKAELNGRLARKVGIESGTQIVRHIRLKFTAAPGKKVLYRVVWKQTALRGEFEIGVGQRVYAVPYMVTFGLAHVVQSIDLAEPVQ